MHYSDLLSFLNELGVCPKKSLSQNFLIDGNICRKIIQIADIRPGDVVLEIGSGPGALTKLLLDAGATVHAIEKDETFAKALFRFQTEDQRLKVYAADALKFPLSQIPFQKIVANLPYHITTPLLEKFFLSEQKAPMTLMVQKEFADRLFANSGTKDFGSLTLFAQFYAHLKNRFTVSSSCFYPKPSVDSSVIHLEPRASLLEASDHFFPLMRKAFQMRRKCLSTSLKPFASSLKIKEALKASSLREDARPEALCLEEWLLFIKIFNPCIVQEDATSCRDRKTSD